VIDPRNNERLLSDVLGEGAGDGFREALLRETLRQAGRRRRMRQGRRIGLALAAVMGLGVLAWWFFPAGGRSARLGRPYRIVRTAPLSPGAWVETKPLGAGRQVATAGTAVAVVTSQKSGLVRQLSDEDLLALALPRPAVLVRRGPHSAELVFTDVPDERAAMH
jgi:hypothetical protein